MSIRDHMKQLLLFQESAEERLTRQVEELKKALDKQRKSQFAKIGAVNKMASDALRKIEFLESKICKGAFDFV